jgi:hypothetical protein
MYYGNSGATTTSNGAATFNLFENATASQWVDDSADNPILTPTSGSWDAGHIWVLSDVYVNGTYYLYYTGSTTPYTDYIGAKIGVATSTDDIHWTKYSGNPIISSTGLGWLYSCDTPAVCYVNGTFYMLFNGYKSNGNSAALLATSTNGFDFTLYSSLPVLDDGASWINHNIESGSLTFFNGLFYYYYNVNPSAGITRNTGVATSSNCIDWTVCSNNPVVTTTEGGYGNAIYACVSMAHVVQYGMLNGSPEYLMLMSASSGATSPTDEHLDCLTSFTPMFNSTHYWNPLSSGAVFVSSIGLDNPTPTVIINGAGNTVPYNNSLTILYADGTNARRAIYEPGGSLVNFVNWNRNNEVGTWTTAGGYLQEAGVLYSRAYLWSNLPSMAGYRAVANFSATSGQSYDSYLLARTTSGSSGGSCYALDIAQYTNLIRIYKVTSGTWNLLASTSYTPTSNIQVEFDVYGTSTVTLVGLVNGVQKIAVSDSSSPIASGGFGLACADQPDYTSEFGNIYVTNYVYPEPVQGAWGNEETPTVTITPASVNMTIKTTQQFTSNVTGGLAPYTYQWYYTNGTAITSATASTLTYKANQTGTYNIYLNVTDSSNYKIQSNNATINVYSQPAVTISPASVNMTIGGTQQFNSSASGGLIPYTYQWYYANGTAISGATASSLAYKANFTGTYSIYLNVTDSLNYRTQSNNSTINVNSQPTVTISPVAVNMTVETLQTFNSTVSGGTPPVSYQWYLNGSQVSSATASTWTFNSTSAGTFIIYLKITDSYNITAQSNNATVKVETPTNVNVTPTQVKMYLGQSQTFNSTLSGGTAPYSYQWYLNDTAVSGATNQNWIFTPTVAGNYKVYLNVTDALNIKAQSNIVTDITVYSQLTASISPVSMNMTVGMQQTFNSNVSGGAQPYSYKWYLNRSQVPNANASTWTFTPTSPGNFSIYLTVTDNNTASAQSNNATITVETPTNVTITPIQVRMYVGQSQTFNSSVSGGTTPYTYQWYLNDTAQSGATGSTWTFTPTSAGNYKVYLNVTDAFNLKAQSNIITNITMYPQLTVSISPTSVNMTVGGSQTFSSTVSGGAIPYTYQWYQNSTAISGATSANYTFTPTSAGNYIISLRVTDNYTATAQSNNATARVETPTTATITPTHVGMYVGQSQTFNSSVSGGTPPYLYQWCLNDSAVSGATSANWTFTPTSAGNYKVYLNVTDNLNLESQSNIVTDITVYPQLTVSITPVSINMTFGTQQTFNSTVSGGNPPYIYQWYVNNTAILGATNANFTFTPRANGNYQIYVNVTDSLTSQGKSNVAGINVYSVYLLLNVDTQAPFAKGQQVTFTVTVLNQQNPRLESCLALTIIGPGGYSYYDFQPINVSANGVDEYTFVWVVSNVAGTYVVETGLVPAQLTAYDAKWLEVGESSTGFGVSQGTNLVVSKILMNTNYAALVLIEGLALSDVCCIFLLKYRVNKLRTFSRNQ